MWLILAFILSSALALPSQEPPLPRPNCIRMTPEKEQQIDLIVEKLGQFLNNLTIEHEHFDIRLIKLSIEQHTEDEVEEKETVLQLSVNDCQLTDSELDEIEHHREKAKQLEKEREAKGEKLKQEKQENNKKADAEPKEQISVEKPDTQNNDENTNAYDEAKVVTKKEQIHKKEEQETSETSANSRKETEAANNNQQTQGKHETPNSQKQEETVKEEKESHENETTSSSKNEDLILEKDPECDDKTNQEAEETNVNNGQSQTNKKVQLMYLDLDENGQKLVEALGKKKKGPRIVYVQERNSGQTEYWFLKRR